VPPRSVAPLNCLGQSRPDFASCLSNGRAERVPSPHNSPGAERLHPRARPNLRSQRCAIARRTNRPARTLASLPASPLQVGLVVPDLTTARRRPVCRGIVECGRRQARHPLPPSPPAGTPNSPSATHRRHQERRARHRRSPRRLCFALQRRLGSTERSAEPGCRSLPPPHRCRRSTHRRR